MTEPLELDATDLAKAIRRGDLSAAETTNAALDAADKLGPAVGAFVTVTADLARHQAAQADALLATARRDGTLDSLPPFLGVPCPIKDLNAVKGVPMNAGSAALAGFVPDYDDGVVTRLREAGTIMIGKTSTPEFGMPCYTEPDIGPTARTPWDLTRSAGGSSGGAAAAVSAGIVPVAHGSDGGGSLRIPASACGLVAIKPSRGLVSCGPWIADNAGLATHGVLARSVRDVAAFLDILARPWPGDTYTAPRPPSFSALLGRETPRLRVGLLLEPVVAPNADVDPACLDAATAAATALGDWGHEVVAVRPPFTAESWKPFESLWAVLGLQTPVPADREELLVPLTRYLRAAGRQVTGLQYANAVAAAQLLTRQVARQWAEIDVVVSPTLAALPAPVGSQRIDDDPAGDFAAQTAFTPWTSVWNMIGWPAMSIPLGEAVTATGVRLPVGVMIGAAHGRDGLLLELAAKFEKRLPWAHRHPARTAAQMPGYGVGGPSGDSRTPRTDASS